MTDLTTVLYSSVDALWAFIVWVCLVGMCSTVLTSFGVVLAYRRRREWMPRVVRLYGELRRLWEVA